MPSDGKISLGKTNIPDLDRLGKIGVADALYEDESLSQDPDTINKQLRVAAVSLLFFFHG